ncbi:hypothetical protein [Bacillus paralicheniformis]|uniref:hypothetical protein n=1 Tax=Bacillus paralicheniformis TaxID=1648923 RepID=UPI00227ECD3E|nr:hypothetical protein [Bacillus paralicheniformis]MCY8151416.1 hypothetical protein [Bacillus paralicheniformis]MCY9422189.1 hypothetical protein [Bacillus paralicheniformis]MEC0580075.1 hypothetical protein [Bacillus paralicheniformis]
MQSRVKNRQHQYINNPIINFVDKLIELMKKALYGIAGVLLVFVVMAALYVIGSGGDDKAGDELRLGQSITGANSIENLEKNSGNLFNVEGETITISKHQRIKIIKILEEDNLALIEVLSGSNKGTQWWVKKSSIRRDYKSRSSKK